MVISGKIRMEIDNLRTRLNGLIEKGSELEEVELYKLSVELDNLIAEYYNQKIK